MIYALYVASRTHMHAHYNHSLHSLHCPGQTRRGLCSRLQTAVGGWSCGWPYPTPKSCDHRWAELRPIKCSNMYTPIHTLRQNEEGLHMAGFIHTCVQHCLISCVLNAVMLTGAALAMHGARRGCTRSALKGYPKAALCATSKLCQYSSGTNAVWHNRTLKHRTRRDIGRTAHSYFRPAGRADILPLWLRTFSQKSDRHVASSCAIGTRKLRVT